MVGLRSASLAQTMGDQTVIIYVGSGRKRYLIHKELLTKQSEYFDKAFNGSFKEADAQSIHLEEESPAAFDLFVGWLYQGYIPVAGQSLSLFRSSKDSPAKGSFGSSPFGLQGKSAQEPSINQTMIVSRRHLPASPFSSSIFRANLNVAQTAISNLPQQNQGTVKISYRPYVEQAWIPAPTTDPSGPNQTDTFTSISAQPECRNWSVEELRVKDYTTGKAGPVQARSSAGVGSSLFTSFGSAPKPRPDNVFYTEGRIPGIPVCQSLQATTDLEEAHQLAVLQLIIFAETHCWNNLFDCAMTAYVEGEFNLAHRPIPTTHLTLIHQRSGPNSPCRDFASDAITANLHKPIAQKKYLDWAIDNPTFLEDIFKSLGRKSDLTARDWKNSPTCLYHIHQPGHICPIATDQEAFARKEMPVGPYQQELRSLFSSPSTPNGNI